MELSQKKASQPLQDITSYDNKFPSTDTGVWTEVYSKKNSCIFLHFASVIHTLYIYVYLDRMFQHKHQTRSTYGKIDCSFRFYIRL